MFGMSYYNYKSKDDKSYMLRSLFGNVVVLKKDWLV